MCRWLLPAFCGCFPSGFPFVPYLVRIVLDYITAGTDIHILATDTGQYDERMGILAQKKREDKFRFFNMKPESYVILRIFGNPLEVKPL